MPRAEQVTDRCSYHGEGPFWDDRADRLRFVDMLAGDVVTLLPTATLTRRHIADIAAVIRGREDGGYLVAVERGFALLDGDWNHLETVRAFDDPTLRMNEGNVDPQGRFYCGTMSYGSATGAGTLYRFDPDHMVHTVLESVTIPNGLQWSPDGQRVFHVDTPTGRIDTYDFDADAGLLLNPRPFVTISVGAPDGTTMDDEGGMWVALWGGGAVHRYDAEGVLSEVIDLPVTNVTACTFAGPGSSTLYITTSMQGIDASTELGAGAIFVADVGARGVPQVRYAG